MIRVPLAALLVSLLACLAGAQAQTAVIPAGTSIRVQLTGPIDSGVSQAG